MFPWDWQIDGWIIVAGALCAAAAALLGNFLVLRRMSLMGDAISHAVLPGLVAAFLISDKLQGPLMFIGAASVGVLTVLLTEFATRYGKVDEGASIGVVFTFLFAVGLLMIVRLADRVDLDPGCVLYGSLENAVMDTVTIRPLGDLEVPRVVISLSFVLLANLLLVTLLYRQLKISTFDPHLAQSQGVPVAALHYLLAAFVAVTAVAAFESVGNILVVAMFVVPPVAAWLLTDRLGTMIALSVLIGVASAGLGHISAIVVPRWFGYGSTNTAGMMAVSVGAFLLLVALFAPRKGIVSRAIRHLQVAWQIVSEDILASLYRSEQAGEATVSVNQLRQRLFAPNVRTWIVLHWLKFQGHITQDDGALSLAESGRNAAQNVVRSHRLWEHYLASESILPESLLHEGAEELEHFTDRTLRERLIEEMNAPDVDPHGKPIPPEA